MGLRQAVSTFWSVVFYTTPQVKINSFYRVHDKLAVK